MKKMCGNPSEKILVIKAIWHDLISFWFNFWFCHLNHLWKMRLFRLIQFYMRWKNVIDLYREIMQWNAIHATNTNRKTKSRYIYFSYVLAMLSSFSNLHNFLQCISLYANNYKDVSIKYCLIRRIYYWDVLS